MIAQPIDGPPPSPVTDTAAAKEAGQPGPGAQGSAGIQGLAAPMGMTPQGPDLSGILVLGEKLEQAILTLGQAVPMLAPDCDQMRSILINALGRFASSAGQGSGSSPKDPMAPQPTGQVVSQAGPQFPGAQGGGKPF